MESVNPFSIFTFQYLSHNLKNDQFGKGFLFALLSQTFKTPKGLQFPK
jgi:hypothetical protein